MHDWWIKFGCWLIGYNYSIINNCSEASRKIVKKYTSAILILVIIWGFIGFTFAQRYVQASTVVSIIVAIIMIFIVIQIERQIILTFKRNNWAFVFRIAIAIIMAFIGSVIIDQFIFKHDIEKAQIDFIQKRVNEILPVKSKELLVQIAQIDSLINKKELQREQIINHISRNPKIKTYEVKSSFNKDTLVGREILLKEVPNPNIPLIEQLDNQLKQLRTEKAIKEDKLLNMRNDLETELKQKNGLIDELNILIKEILLKSWINSVLWVLIFLFFLLIEGFVLVTKFSDDHADYEDIINLQVNKRRKSINEIM